MYNSKSIEELHELLISKKITPLTLVEESFQKSNEVQEKCNAFVTIIPLEKIKETMPKEVDENLLSGIRVHLIP